MLSISHFIVLPLANLLIVGNSLALPNESLQQTATTWQHAYKTDGKARRLEQLSPEQRRITQKDGTEPAFKNAYWDNKKPGIYVDVVSGEPLFSSKDKYKSGTGWPSFVRTINNNAVNYKADHTLFSKRTEVRSKLANSHLGHVFDDGPVPTGKRYCINSAALKFIPAEQLKEKGYGEYVGLFKR